MYNTAKGKKPMFMRGMGAKMARLLQPANALTPPSFLDIKALYDEAHAQRDAARLALKRSRFLMTQAESLERAYRKGLVTGGRLSSSV